MHTLRVVNIKCGGCETEVIAALNKIGASQVRVDVDAQIVTFEGNVAGVAEKLDQMGYPMAGSKEAKSLTKKAKSYVSCMIGKKQRILTDNW